MVDAALDSLRPRNVVPLPARLSGGHIKGHQGGFLAASRAALNQAHVIIAGDHTLRLSSLVPPEEPARLDVHCSNRALVGHDQGLFVAEQQARAPGLWIFADGFAGGGVQGKQRVAGDGEQIAPRGHRRGSVAGQPLHDECTRS